MQRLHGNTITSPDHNYFVPVEDASEAAWTQTLKNLGESQEAWTKFLTDFKEDNFEEMYSNSGMTQYELILGILQHDAYHLGQIVMLAKNAPELKSIAV